MARIWAIGEVLCCMMANGNDVCVIALGGPGGLAGADLKSAPARFSDLAIIHFFNAIQNVPEKEESRI